jgi:tetratricopeptide (TPR) repeat protein
MLEITKEGYESQHIFIAQDNTQESYNINIKLKMKNEDLKGLDMKSRQERLAKNLTRSSNLINKKRYVEAEQILVETVRDFPHVSVGYDLLGNVSYLQRDFRAALNYYRKSFQLNPENSETKLMIDKLEGMTR